MNSKKGRGDQFSPLSLFLFAETGYVLAAGCSGIDISLAGHFVVMVVVFFFIALPSVPGFWGVWEAGGVFALSLIGVSSAEAAGFTLANHAVRIFSVIIVGLVSAVVTGVDLWDLPCKKIKYSE
jgi:hypothetical protein